MALLRYGTCSWKYDSWKGLVYSEEAHRNYLKEYATHYNTVEIDQWFWSLHGENKISLPQPQVVAEYSNSVPDDFKFTIKIPNSITLTHFYRQNKNEPLKPNPHFLSVDIFREFIHRLEPLSGRLGPLMFQFEYLNKQKMPSQQIFLERFGNFINKLDRNYIFALEIRNPNYLNGSYFSFLRDLKLQHVFLQGYYMPAIFEIYDTCKDHLAGGTVICLHGPDRRGMEKESEGAWNKRFAPKEAELARVVSMVQDLLERDLDVYLNVNNHYEGSAPLTIEKIKELFHILPRRPEV